MTKIAYLLSLSLFILPGILGAQINKDSCSSHSMKYQGADARRIWLASYLPAEAQEQLVGVQDQLKAMGLTTGYYERPDRLHVTILPIGSIRGVNNPQPANAVADALSKVALGPALVKIKKIEVLTTGSGQPRLVWAVLDSVDLETMQRNIQNALESFCDIDRASFHPHITLYRFSLNASKKVLAPKLAQKINSIDISNLAEFHIDGFNLLESGKKFKDDYILLKEFKSQPQEVSVPQKAKLYLKKYWKNLKNRLIGATNSHVF